MTVIIPFHRRLAYLARSLPAARLSLPSADIVVVADGADEDCRPVAAASDARVIEVPGPRGPAVARNRGADAATGDVLIFVDADVVVAPAALPALCAHLEREPAVAAVFGAYGEAPPAANFMSQYRNLAHALVHQRGDVDASTFWAGLGAVRVSAFRGVGGFDERFARPSVEDIDLGYRLRRAGHRVRLDATIRGEHLRPWTMAGAIVTDIRDRGVPWTQLILKYRPPVDDLNTRQSLRWAVVLTYLLLGGLLAAWRAPWALAAAALALLGLVGLGAAQWRWFAARRGAWFASRAFAAHLVHHVCNGVSFATGLLLYATSRLGLRLPGAVPLTEWGR